MIQARNRRKLFLAVGLSLMFVALFASISQAQSDHPLRVMTYNVKYASDRPPHAWGDRRPVARAMIEKYAPDVIGMQEALYRQVRDFATDLPEYDWIGLGREGGSRGEFMSVFYRKDRLQPIEFDHFWLSDTPNVIGSTTWGNTNRRMVTWIRFRDIKTKKSFYFLNTHFDHRIREAREKSARLVRERVSQLDPDVPKILLGDFNAIAENSDVYSTLVNDEAFSDAWSIAAKRGDAISTIHGYRGPKPGGRRIDWILLQGDLKCRYSEVVTFSENGQYPSDHFPVIADIEFPKSH